jgi:hypothetical protein
VFSTRDVLVAIDAVAHVMSSLRTRRRFLKFPTNALTRLTFWIIPALADLLKIEAVLTFNQRHF